MNVVYIRSKKGLRRCEIAGGMRGTCEGHISCFEGGTYKSGIKKAANSAALVTSYYATAGYFRDEDSDLRAREG